VIEQAFDNVRANESARAGDENGVVGGDDGVHYCTGDGGSHLVSISRRTAEN